VRSIFVFMAVLGLLASGCNKKSGTAEEQASNESGSAAQMMPDTTLGDSREVIPSSNVPENPIEGLFLDPFFDEAGTSTELSVARGEQFKLYIMAKTVDPYQTLSAQLRLEMPPGINVLYVVETPKKLSSLGNFDFNYMVAYDCTPPGRFVVVSYVCQAADDFQGGEIRVLPGFLADNATFLGFATCEFIEVRAAGGTATLKLKA
jgi:hypothetical protein